MDAELADDLARLQDAVQRTGATLLALEQDPTLQLLDASALAGETAARWADVAAARTALFRAHRELSDVVERATAARRSGEVASMLRGPSVVRADTARPLAERGLLEASRRVERGTPEQLLADMAVKFDDVRGVVAAVERAWAEAIPWIRDGRGRLAALVGEAATLGTPPPAALDGVGDELDALAESALADPLAWSPAAVVAVATRLDEAGQELADLRSVRDDWSGQLAAARALVASLGAAVATTNGVVARATTRVAAVPSSPPCDPAPELAAELEALAARAGAVAWPEVAADLATWRITVQGAIATLRTRAAEHQALLDQRDELRGRLDAYEAKAARLHLLEHSSLAELHRRAHDALHTSPTDLVQAHELVGRYGDALRADTAVTVAERCRRVGCTGTIDDGYCDDCGLAPAADGHRPTEVNGATVAPAHPMTTSRPLGTATISRGRLGAGMVDIPPVPARDPETAVMADPIVAEHRRFCANCDEPVGRSRDQQPGRTQGFCRACGTPFSFLASLGPGDLVAGQYEVVGCLAHGGLGWIYLARDHFVSERWVVLKGLLDSRDEHAMAAALAERRFLAEVEHPNIVKIHNFVEHHGDGYIVMEFVDGVSLKDMLEDRRRANGGRPDPLPVEQAIAFCLEILPALAHLHDLGLVFCDFKPDNVIQSRGSVKLIDLGGVYRMDDRSSPVYGTVGYQAPEIARTGPTVASDLFTVARTLAVLATDFTGYQSTYRYTLPPASAVPVYSRFASLHTFLERATAADPDERFQSADEMGAQLLGVLREIVATGGSTLPTAASTRFTPPLRGSLDHPDWRTLPTPLVNPDDPAAAVMLSLPDPDEVIRRLGPQRGSALETDLWLARSLILRDRGGEALTVLASAESADRWDWRTTWYHGLAALAEGDAAPARSSFERVYRALPGELAPKLALALTEEVAGDPARAAGWYEIVARTDPTFTSASFGLARCRTAMGDRAGAVAAYDRVLDTSSAHADALMAQAGLLLDADGPDAVADLVQAASLIEQVPADREQRAPLAARLLECSLAAVRNGAPTPAGDVTVLGVPLRERDLRLGLERTYRGLARRATTEDERVALVDRANAVRPRTWW